MIRTAFRLPFRAVHPPDGFFCSDEEVYLFLEFEREPTPSQVALADGLMLLFTDFAATGAMSSRQLVTHRSRVDLGPIAMRSSILRVYSLTHCSIDDAAMVVLCDMLMREGDVLRLRSFVVSNGGQGVEMQQDPSSWSTYPRRHETPVFDIDDQQPESGGYTFVIDLAEPLRASAREVLSARLGLWTRCVLAGGYALAPIEPKFNYVEPEDSVVEFATTLEWTVFKLRAHPAAIDALVNLFAFFSEETQPVLRLTIQ